MSTLEKRKGIGFLAIGSELLDGRVHESNALFAARALADFGVGLAGVTLCDDAESEITDALDHLINYSSIIIVSGGLGPTTDDLTREALAHYCGVTLFEDAGSLEYIKSIFEKRQRSFNPTNAKQASFPVGATIIINPVGTAPGFSIVTEKPGRKVILIALPGVPKEYTTMFSESVQPLILSSLGITHIPPRKLIRVFGLPESEIGGRVEALKLSSELSISYRAHFPEIQVKIGHERDTELVAESMKRIEAALGSDRIFARSLDVRFEDYALDIVLQKNLTIGLAESCTGGAIGHLITNVPGASKVFLGSIVSYANQAKKALLGVSSASLDSVGAVSEEIASEMALGARQRFGSDIALSITGIAGPDGGSEDKPVGTYFIGLATSDGCQVFKLFFLSSRENFKRFVSWVALDILRRYVSGLTLEHYQHKK
jgi:nicotinamide-nucleotide amidase